MANEKWQRPVHLRECCHCSSCSNLSPGCVRPALCRPVVFARFLSPVVLFARSLFARGRLGLCLEVGPDLCLQFAALANKMPERGNHARDKTGKTKPGEKTPGEEKMGDITGRTKPGRNNKRANKTTSYEIRAKQNPGEQQNGRNKRKG